MFTSTKLRQIVAIDRAGSLSAASQVLNISQSTLTKAVADVEQDLGLAIFHRTARGVSATPEGREFLNRAEKIVADFDMLVEEPDHRRSRSSNFASYISPASQEVFTIAPLAFVENQPEYLPNMLGLPVERGAHVEARRPRSAVRPTEERHESPTLLSKSWANSIPGSFAAEGIPFCQNHRFRWT